MSYVSPEEVSQQYADKFGEEDGAVVHRLTHSTSQLFREWRLFLYLFCGPTERVDVLNTASGSTANVLGNLLWDNAVLKIRALTDEEITGQKSKKGDETKQKRNMSLQNLCRIAKDLGIHDFDGPFVQMTDTCKPCRDFATKYLAHKDYGHSMGRQSITLTRRDTTTSVEAVGDFVRLFHSRVCNTDHLLSPTTGAESEEQFLAMLYLGALKQEEMRTAGLEDLRAGRYDTRSEYEWPEWVRADELRDTPFSIG